MIYFFRNHFYNKQIVASTWVGDHQGRPSAHTNSLYKLYLARYQVLFTYLLTHICPTLTPHGCGWYPKLHYTGEASYYIVS